jgi:hypothetical protein
MQMLPGSDWRVRLRETCFPFLAVAIVSSVLVSVPTPVAAQTKLEYKFDPAKLTWQEYRRADLGFRVEFPAEPMITVNESPDKRSKEIFLEAMFDRATFGMTVWEFPGRGRMTQEQANETLGHIARSLQLTFGLEPRVSQFTMSGAPGREDIFEFKDSIMQYRAVVYSGRVIQISFARDLPDVDIQPAGERFLISFTLLPIP